MGIERSAPPRARAARLPDGNPYDGARVTDDPVKIARIRYGLALDALLAIRPWCRDERELGRQVFDIAAGELDAAIAERRRRPPPLPVAGPARPRPPPLLRPAVANDLLGGIFADG